jgi:phospholipid/cholesterol/gamma-HCH transport system substrate-binding protein
VKISKEFKVGVLAVVSMVILYFGFNFLKGIDLFKDTKIYYALYENIDGLTESNPVVINGLSVGRVSYIDILQERGNLVAVEVSIDSKLKLSEGTIARLVNTDFLGSKAIELMLRDSVTVYYEDGDTLRSEVDKGITEFLKQSAGPVADNIGTTISRINVILESFSGNSDKINGTLANLESVTGNLSTNLPYMENKLYVLLDNLAKSSQDLSATLTDLKPVLANATQFTDSLKNLELAVTLGKFELLLDNLNVSIENMKEGQGTMGKLMHDDSLYINLNNTARDLDKLLVDLQENPGRYVQISMFGKKDKSEKDKDKKQDEGK